MQTVRQAVFAVDPTLPIFEIRTLENLITESMGNRTALGATRPVLFRLVMKSGLGLAGIGLSLGVGGSLLLTRLMESQLYGVDATDPVTLVVVAGIGLPLAEDPGIAYTCFQHI